MNFNKNNKNYSLGNALILVFFFFFIGSFSKPPVQIHGKNYQIQQASEIHAHTTAIEVAQILPLHNQDIAIIDLSLVLNNEFSNRIIVFNRNLQYYYSLLKCKEISIRANLIQQFEFINRIRSTEIPHILS